MKKVWLSIMFMPIEEASELARLRSFMSPFMINIQKCFDSKELSQTEIKQICDDVINSISPFVDPELLNCLNQILTRPESRTLGLEHGAFRQISIR